MRTGYKKASLRSLVADKRDGDGWCGTCCTVDLHHMRSSFRRIDGISDLEGLAQIRAFHVLSVFQLLSLLVRQPISLPRLGSSYTVCFSLCSLHIVSQLDQRDSNCGLSGSISCKAGSVVNPQSPSVCHGF